MSCNSPVKKPKNTLENLIEFAINIAPDVSPDSAVVHFKIALIKAKILNAKKEQVFLHNKIAENYIVFDLKKTKAHLDSSLRISKDSRVEYPELGATYDDLGLYYEFINKYDSGLYFIKKGLEFRLKNLPENHDETGNSYLSLAYHYGNVRQEYDKAFFYTDKALSIRKSIYKEDHERIAECYNNLAFFHSVLGNYEKALIYQKKSMEIVEKSSKESSTAILTNYGNLGKFLTNLNRKEEAISYFQKTIKFEENDQTKFYLADAFVSLGQIYQYQDREKARKYYQKAFAIYQKELPPDHRIIGNVHHQIGLFLTKSSLYDSAWHHYRIAEKICAKNVDNDPASYANLLMSFSDLNYKSSAFINSIQSAEKAIKLFTIPNAHQKKTGQNLSENIVSSRLEMYYALFLKGRALMAKGDVKSLKSALIVLQESIHNIELLKKGYNNHQARANLTNRTTLIFDLTMETILSLYHLTNDETYLQKAFSVAEKNRAFNLITAVAESKAKKFTGIPEEIQEREELLKRDLTFYREKVYTASRRNEQTTILDPLEKKLFETEVAYDQLVRELGINYPEYFKLKNQDKVISYKDVKQQLKKDEVLIEYYVAKSTIYIIIITHNNIRILDSPKSNSFETQIKNLYISINKYQRENFLKYSHALNELLIAPVLEKLPNTVKKLRIIPHNDLAYVSFDCLVNSENDSEADFKYLIEDFEITYHYSATLPFTNLYEDKPNKKISLFAPVFDRVSFDKLPSLPGSENETQGISDLFNSAGLTADLYLRKEADKSTFERASKTSGLVHLATHVILDKNSIENSAIYFYPTGSSAESSTLKLSETYNINLRAQLLTLSSCESGIGQLVKGEGMLSFTRGFSYSGTQNISCSLWKVNDLYTSQVMINFYKEILKGKSFASSLRTAKLSLLLSDKKNLSPKEWAGFILISN